MDVFSNRTDSGTLIPFMKQMEKKHSSRYREVVADAGYESLDNLLFLERSGQICFVKPANYAAQKKRNFVLRSDEWKTCATIHRKTFFSARRAADFCAGESRPNGERVSP